MIPTDAPSSPANLAGLIKEINRDPQGARNLDTGEARALFRAMLDGAAPPLELGSVLLAYRIKGETVAEMVGFMTALNERVARLDIIADRPRPVVLPTYDGTRRLPNLTALLALLLRRYGVPVLLHGMTDPGSHFGRVATVTVLRELGIGAVASVGDAQRRLASEGIAYATVESLAPELAGLLALRRRMGPCSSAHTLAKLIDPFDGAGFRVVSVSHSDHLKRMRQFLVATRADALLLRGTEGEPFANPRRQPQLEWLNGGIAAVLFDAEAGKLTAPPTLPSAADAPAIAAWIAAALAGEQPIPSPILNQLACCMHATRRISAGV
jgi:anthranilate phosphoribosyltransferase